MEERRKNYIDLGNKLDALGKEVANNSKEQAITNANLQNVLKMFHDHLADDKKTAEKVDGLITREARTDGRIIGLSAACTVIGFVIGKVTMKWFGL